MKGNHVFVCRHNPLGLSNGFIRLLSYTFRRKASIEESTCGVCGTPVYVPKLYSGASILVLFYIISFLCAALTFELSLSGFWWALVIHPVVLFAVYRIITAVIMSFGSWVPAEDENPTPYANYKKHNSNFYNAYFFGFMIANANYRGMPISICILIFSVMLAIGFLLQKRWILAVLMLVFMLYGGVSLFFLAKTDPAVGLIDNLLLVPILFALFSLEPDKSLRKKEHLADT